MEDEKELAMKTKHSTALEAGMIAVESHVRNVILNHFSARHASTQPIYEEALKEHPNVTIAKDLLEIELS
ncbi:hypothetical protein LCGC14_1081500 [marine sediment metagenome]|uniref:Uncharacterized protein n=1 Tax=marine sediment metagenome TaxID=412755 RepID=A0A0F9MJR8_9ZZZZ